MALARSIRLLIALIVYIGYLCLGAVIFRTIEIPHGKEIARKFEHIKSEFLLANAGVSGEFWVALKV